MKIFYYTSTGNCLDIAKRIGGELISIPQALKDNNLEYTGDKIGIIFPAYYIGTPVVVQEFLKKVKLKSNYIFAIMTYGNFSGGGVDHFRKMAAKNGIRLSYLNEIVMVDNYLPMFDMDDQAAKIKSKKIDENADKIIRDINASKIYILKKNFFNNLISFLGQKMYLSSHGTKDKKFIVEYTCTFCGICKKVCPAGNITSDKKPVFNGKCYECFACTHACPTNSIRLKGEKSKARYRNSNVTVKEIIQANNLNP